MRSFRESKQGSRSRLKGLQDVKASQGLGGAGKTAEREEETRRGSPPALRIQQRAGPWGPSGRSVCHVLRAVQGWRGEAVLASSG